MWQQKELTNGAYSFADLIDAHEVLDWKAENERRFKEWVKQNPKG